MNRGPLLFLGLLVVMSLSWLGFVLGPQMQIGSLGQTNSVVVGGALPRTYPIAPSGLAHQGAEIYRASGCEACHTQMVRPSDLGPDLARGWGARRSVAEDYLFEQPVMLGNERVGPDLANYGRRTFREQILQRLYDPRIVAPGSIMPSYSYMFDVRKIGRQPDPDALSLPPAFAPPPGMEIVPKPEANALAGYLLSLRQDAYLYVVPPPLPPPTNKVQKPNPTVKK